MRLPSNHNIRQHGPGKDKDIEPDPGDMAHGGNSFCPGRGRGTSDESAVAFNLVCWNLEMQSEIQMHHSVLRSRRCLPRTDRTRCAGASLRALSLRFVNETVNHSAGSRSLPGTGTPSNSMGLFPVIRNK